MKELLFSLVEGYIRILAQLTDWATSQPSPLIWGQILEGRDALFM